MIRIAFCDDDITVLNALRALLDRYRAERELEIDAAAFCSPLDLMAEIERGVRFDILLLDVLMPGETGIDAAAEIRSYDSDVKIIFLTTSAEFAVQSYAVGAYYYQLKPVREADFFRLMDAVLSTCEKEQAASLILRCKSGITRVEHKRLEYCEVIHRNLFFHLTGGRILETIGSMDELSQQLMRYDCFLRLHRSYLINLEHVQNLGCRSVTMTCGTEIPIPRGKYNEVKNAFLEYAFRSKQVIL